MFPSLSPGSFAGPVADAEAALTDFSCAQPLRTCSGRPCLGPCGGPGNKIPWQCKPHFPDCSASSVPNSNVILFIPARGRGWEYKIAQWGWSELTSLKFVFHKVTRIHDFTEALFQCYFWAGKIPFRTVICQYALFKRKN